MRSQACRSKAHWAYVSDAMRAAHRWEMKHGYVFQWYRCDECDQFHLRTKRHNGVKVLSLDGLRQAKGRSQL